MFRVLCASTHTKKDRVGSHMRFIFYMVICSAFCGAAYAGNLSLKDGDSFVLNGEEIRLWGIDAPEYKQSCFNERALPYLCGQEALNMLAEIIGENTMHCTTKSTDRYGRKVSKCDIGGHDIGAMMVRSGHAIDYKYFSDGYYSSEQRYAKARKLGLWRGKCMSPRTWRKRR